MGSCSLPNVTLSIRMGTVTKGCEDGAESKMVALQEWGPDVDPRTRWSQNPHYKSFCLVCTCSHRPGDTETSRSRGLTGHSTYNINKCKASERPWLTKQGRWFLKSCTQGWPLASIHTCAYTPICTYLNTNTDLKEIVIILISTKLLEQEKKIGKKRPNAYHKDDGRNIKVVGGGREHRA